MHIQEQARSPIEVCPACPTKLNDLIMKAMEKKREDRFQTCQEMIEALQHLDEPDEPVHVEVPMVDLTKATGEQAPLPEDDIKGTTQARAAQPHLSKLQQNLRNESVRNLLRLIAMMAAFTIVFLGAFKGYQVYTQAQARIECFPSGADVTLNGQSVGTSPISLTLSPGSYKITLSSPGYKEQNIRLDLQPQEKLEIKRFLRKPDPEALRKLEDVIGGYTSVSASVAKKKPQMLAEAWRKIEEFLDESENNEDVHLSFIKLCEKNGMLGSAQQYYKSRSEKAPENWLYLTMLGKIHFAKREYKVALDVLNRAFLTKDPHQTALLNALGDYFVHDKDKARATNYYEGSLYLDPDQKEIVDKLEKVKKGL